MLCQESYEIPELQPRIWYGYLGNIPNAPLGAAVGITKIDRIGYFIAFKTNSKLHADDASDFYPDISLNKAQNILGDKKIDESTGCRSFEIGITSRAATNLFFYIGIGYGYSAKYMQFYDRFEILGSNGKYWIRTEENSSVNFLGGLMYFIGTGLYLQFGADTFPGGLNIGIGWSSILNIF
jgi:hypothetical protein